MLKHGILGLLSYGEMTGYEIMHVFRDSLSHFWTAQTSQIYRELQTLKNKGWVIDRCVPQTGKPDKNIFSITESGKEELHRWLLEEGTVVEANSPLLMKTFFRGELGIDENIEFFQRVQAYGDFFLANAKETGENVEEYQKIVVDSMRALYWKMTFEYGVMYMRMLREWASKCILELEAIKNEYPNH